MVNASSRHGNLPVPQMAAVVTVLTKKAASELRDLHNYSTMSKLNLSFVSCAAYAAKVANDSQVGENVLSL